MTRREILRQSALQAGAIWAMLGQTHSHENAAAPSGGLRFFTPEQAAEVEAVAAQIIPADESGGAREAGVVRFIDLNLAAYEKDKQAAYTEGLKMLAAKCGGRFSDLPPAKQIEVLRSMERKPSVEVVFRADPQSDFFELVRRHTILGFFSHPQYGGNRDRIGWKLIGFEDAGVYQPPFGYYDGPGRSEP
ncbi:MAG TPA: gluconate 2-dehydrogenase subunit 3 family protein [Verrucomicrobiae bacterium]|nr:gluconate 2-dehydrogenase subunit 3 family protein [Verrucomicrobiae bacterium]